MTEYTKEALRELLEKNDAAVWRGLLAIFKEQTADEQATGATRWQNGFGFSAFDAEILTSFAQQVVKWQSTAPDQRKFNSPLSPKQLNLARKKMLRYAGQLVKIANRGTGEGVEV